MYRKAPFRARALFDLTAGLCLGLSSILSDANKLLFYYLYLKFSSTETRIEEIVASYH